VFLDLTSRLPLGQGLWRSEEQILKSFHQNCPEAREWLPEGDLAAGSVVTSQLRDMVDRGLLVKVSYSGEAAAYRLKFHHHLASLLADLQLSTEIRTNLQAWRQTRPDTGVKDAGDARGPLHRSDMLWLREMLRGELGDLAPAAVAVGSLWDVALNAETGGLADRLGLDPFKVGDALEAPHDAGTFMRRLWKNASPDALRRALGVSPQGERPLLLTGGIDLLREAVQQGRAEPGRVEALGPYRLTDGRVRWWFQRVRGVEFPTEQDYDEVYQLTAGIPLLVGKFDHLLMPQGPSPGGVNPSQSELYGIRRRFEEDLRKDHFGLDHGPPARRLTERERDLVRMVHVISAEFQGDPQLELAEWLRDGWAPDPFGSRWEELYGGRPFPVRYLDEPGDPVCLETLLLLGLLPARDGYEAAGRVKPLTDTDPIVRLWPRLG
jgi:hypothetical protein